ncbi:hypothetical protein [Campylobacter jejuni]|uniref:hypothetical protein n=1 Tax=Campylobacter jejuni TaxID=197 RepID=UPI00087423BF|nr:hypothetical protein [Campylobacter jejuni]OEW89866.1 hypothetical protein A0M29_06180 [Campylobacter jejuni]RTJ71917.1 hypothetical protein C3H60_00885 [Campylobacter jejuni]HED5351294.1 hypothetical protein [Campylobacter jejuni]
MLPWLIGIGVAAAGKLIYDTLSDDDYESSSSTQDRQREKERENKQAKYEKVVKEYQTKLKNRYEAECIANPKNKFTGVFPSLKFKKSKKLDDIQKDIKNLKKDMDALWEINMYAKSLIKEENETSVK